MTEQEQKAIKWMKNVRDDAVVTLDHIAKEEPSVSPMLYAGRKEKAETIINGFNELEKYRAIGTVEDIQQKLAELERWHTTEVNPKIKNVFANTSTQICHNCDHKDEYIEELEVEIQQYRAIGTPEECREAVEKQKADKELESHDEKHILKSCLGLMQEMVNDFAEWYRWQHGEDSIEELDEEEIFCIRKTYFRIVQELFLLHTNHSGGTSTRAKCEQLGVDWGEEISFDWSDEE